MSATASPLWPQPIEIIGVTGEFASGKTLFGLSIAPGPQTLIYDLEKSAASYASLGCERRDLPALMQASHPGGYRPIDLFLYWSRDIATIQPGQYRVIVLDPASELEIGLTDWVRDNPQHFGHSAAQYKMSGLFWGDVKELWKRLLTGLAGKCETLCFTNHLSSVWSGDRPIPGKRKAKGKETLFELASLYLQLERLPDASGNVPDVPAARVLKSRLASTRIVDGAVQIVPTLPPRLPRATPAAIRQYMLTPPDYAKLEEAEKAREQGLSEGEMEQLKLARAEIERDTEQARLEQRKLSAANAAAYVAPQSNGAPAMVEPSSTEPDRLINKEQQAALKKLIDQKGIDTEDIRHRYSIHAWTALPAMHFDDCVFWINHKPGFSSPRHELDNKIDQLVIDLKIDHDAFLGRLEQLYQTRDPLQLTMEQREDLLAKLQKAKGGANK